MRINWWAIVWCVISVVEYGEILRRGSEFRSASEDLTRVVQYFRQRDGALGICEASLRGQKQGSAHANEIVDTLYNQVHRLPSTAINNYLLNRLLDVKMSLPYGWRDPDMSQPIFAPSCVGENCVPVPAETER